MMVTVMINMHVLLPINVQHKTRISAITDSNQLGQLPD